jgi:CRISPR/Cas system-associated protein Csm6
MRRRLLIATLALAGLLCSAAIGFAAYLVSRDSVGLPVTRLEPRPSDDLTPARVRRGRRPAPTATTTVRSTTTDDRHGRNRGRGGRHGGDDD